MELAGELIRSFKPPQSTTNSYRKGNNTPTSSPQPHSQHHYRPNKSENKKNKRFVKPNVKQISDNLQCYDSDSSNKTIDAYTSAIYCINSASVSQTQVIGPKTIVKLKINNFKLYTLLDTGANVSLIFFKSYCQMQPSNSFSSKLNTIHNSIQVRDAQQKSIDIIGSVTLKLFTVPHTLLVTKSSIFVDLILGTNVISKNLDIHKILVRKIAPKTNVLSLDSLIDQHNKVFSKHENDIGRTTLVKHTIDTGNATPFKCKTRNIPLALKP